MKHWCLRSVILLFSTGLSSSKWHLEHSCVCLLHFLGKSHKPPKSLWKSNAPVSFCWWLLHSFPNLKCCSLMVTCASSCQFLTCILALNHPNKDLSFCVVRLSSSQQQHDSFSLRWQPTSQKPKQLSESLKEQIFHRQHSEKAVKCIVRPKKTQLKTSGIAGFQKSQSLKIATKKMMVQPNAEDQKLEVSAAFSSNFDTQPLLNVVEWMIHQRDFTTFKSWNQGTKKWAKLSLTISENWQWFSLQQTMVAMLVLTFQTKDKLQTNLMNDWRNNKTSDSSLIQTDCAICICLKPWCKLTSNSVNREGLAHKELNIVAAKQVDFTIHAQKMFFWCQNSIHDGQNSASGGGTRMSSLALATWFKNLVSQGPSMMNDNDLSTKVWCTGICSQLWRLCCHSCETKVPNHFLKKLDLWHAVSLFCTSLFFHSVCILIPLPHQTNLNTSRSGVVRHSFFELTVWNWQHSFVNTADIPSTTCRSCTALLYWGFQKISCKEGATDQVQNCVNLLLHVNQAKNLQHFLSSTQNRIAKLALRLLFHGSHFGPFWSHATQPAHVKDICTCKAHNCTRLFGMVEWNVSFFDRFKSSFFCQQQLFRNFKSLLLTLKPFSTSFKHFLLWLTHVMVVMTRECLFWSGLPRTLGDLVCLRQLHAQSTQQLLSDKKSLQPGSKKLSSAQNDPFIGLGRINGGEEGKFEKNSHQLMWTSGQHQLLPIETSANRPKSSTRFALFSFHFLTIFTARKCFGDFEVASLQQPMVSKAAIQIVWKILKHHFVVPGVRRWQKIH